MENLMNVMMQLTERRRQAGYALVVLIGLAVLTAGVLQVHAGNGDDQEIKKLNSFVQGSKTDTPSGKAFREGRDLIENENWAQAAAKFQGYVREYPKDKDVDAALYWLAYALKKQGKKEEAKPQLLRIISDFPHSSWSKEAKAMLVELGYQNEVNVAITERIVKDQNCELKILALQSLFESDEDRAITIVGDVLRNNTTTDCPALKAAAVSLLGGRGPKVTPILLDIARNNPDLRLRLTAIKRLGEQKSDSVADELAKIYDADQTKEVKIQVLRAFGEMRTARGQAKLVEVARGNGEVIFRQYAIRYLGEQRDAASLDVLIGLFDSDKTPEIHQQILKALSESEDPRARAKIMDIARHGATPELRIYAIRQLAGHGGMALNDLLNLYTDETNMAIKQSMLRTISEIDDPRVMDTLYQAARDTANLDLRIQAIRSLGNRDKDPKVTAELVNMYDAEQNVQVKGALIRAFGDSKDKTAVHKLIAIARSDGSVDLRKLAIRFLGESKDPEALKFLEDLLK